MKASEMAYMARSWVSGRVSRLMGRSSKYGDLRAPQGHSCWGCSVFLFLAMLTLFFLGAIWLLTYESGRALLRLENRYYRWRTGIVKEVDDEY